MRLFTMLLLLCLGNIVFAQQAPKTAVKAQSPQNLPTLSRDSRGVQGFIFTNPDGSRDFRRADSLRAAGALPFRARKIQRQTDSIHTKTNSH